MSYSDEGWRAYVAAYDIEVPQERVAQEYELVRADMKHRMTNAHMMGEETHVLPELELAQIRCFPWASPMTCLST